MDCSPPGSSVYGILQARILEWVAMPSSRGSSGPRDQTWISCTVGRFFTTEPPRKPTCCRVSSVQLSRIQLCVTPMDCSMPGFPVHYQLPELAQTHVQWWVTKADFCLWRKSNPWLPSTLLQRSRREALIMKRAHHRQDWIPWTLSSPHLPLYAKIHWHPLSYHLLSAQAAKGVEEVYFLLSHEQLASKMLCKSLSQTNSIPEDTVQWIKTFTLKDLGTLLGKERSPHSSTTKGTNESKRWQDCSLMAIKNKHI